MKYSPEITLLAKQWKEQCSYQLPRLGTWAKRTVESLPWNERDACGWRDLVVYPDGKKEWQYPRSNSAERVKAFLWLSEVLNDESYEIIAKRYAQAMTNDPIRGIYQGSEKEGNGMVWYWRDIGIYMTNYTMRVPDGFIPLYHRTKNSNFERIVLLSGEALLRNQVSTGLLMEGWKPTQSRAILSSATIASSDGWLSFEKINSRVGYACIAYARLYQFTQDNRYLIALEKLAMAIEERIQKDGSIAQELFVHTTKNYNGEVKGHFLYYILNGVSQASLICPQMRSLKSIALQMGEYLCNWYDIYGHFPYGKPDGNVPQEEMIWRSSVFDPIVGFACLAQISNNSRYVKIAYELAIKAFSQIIDNGSDLDLDGGVAVYCKSGFDIQMILGGYFHFWTILGIQAVMEMEKKMILSLEKDF